MRELGFYNIGEEEYHKDPAVSKSDLDLFHRSPAHYKAKELKEPTPAMIFGSAFHTAVLQPELYEKNYIAMLEGIDGRTKQGKEFKEIAESKDQIILSWKDSIIISDMIKSVKSHETASKLLSGKGHSEISGFWMDKKTGLECKCRLDKTLSAHGLVIDLKTTEDAKLEPFMKSIANYKYHQQAYWYLQGVSIITGIEHKNFVIVAIEKTPPYAVAVYRLDDSMIYLAGEEIKPLMDRMRECKEGDNWPAYSVNIEPISLPDWYLKRAQI